MIFQSNKLRASLRKKRMIHYNGFYFKIYDYPIDPDQVLGKSGIYLQKNYEGGEK